MTLDKNIFNCDHLKVGVGRSTFLRYWEKSVITTIVLGRISLITIGYIHTLCNYALPSQYLYRIWWWWYADADDDDAYDDDNDDDGEEAEVADDFTG